MIIRIEKRLDEDWCDEESLANMTDDEVLELVHENLTGFLATASFTVIRETPTGKCKACENGRPRLPNQSGYWNMDGLIKTEEIQKTNDGYVAKHRCVVCDTAWLETHDYDPGFRGHYLEPIKAKTA